MKELMLNVQLIFDVETNRLKYMPKNEKGQILKLVNQHRQI